MPEITLNIAKRGGPMEEIRITGTRSRSVTEETFSFDHNLEGGHQLKPGHRATFFIDERGWIDEVVSVINIETGARLSLIEAPPPESVRRAAAIDPDGYTRYLETRARGKAPAPKPNRPKDTSTRKGRYTSLTRWR